MRKHSFLLFLIVVIVSISLVFVSCNKNKNEEEDKNTFLLVEVNGEEIIEKEIDITNISLTKGLISILENQEIEYVLDADDFSKFDQLEMYIDGDDIYLIEIYTSNPTDQDDSEYSRTTLYKGIELVNIKCSPSEMTITKGITVLVKLEKV